MILSYHASDTFVLDVAWVEHDTDSSSHGLRWQIASETASDDSIGTVRTGDLSPSDAELLLSRLGIGFGSGHKGDLLSAVELCIVLGVDVSDFDERNVVVLVSVSPLVSEDGTVDEESRGTFGGGSSGGGGGFGHL